MTRSLTVLLLGVLVSGCLSPSTPPTPPPSSSGSQKPDLYYLDCSLGPLVNSSWPDPCTIRASSNPSPSKAEVDLAVNPTDPLNVIVGSKDLDRKASDCVWSVLQVTKDGGKSWKTVYVGGDKNNRVPQLAPFACVTDPIMVFDSHGVAYYALQAYDNSASRSLPAGITGGSSFILARSKDKGETWDHFVVQHVGDGTVLFHDYPRMVVNPKSGSIHTIWNGISSVGVPGVGGVGAVVPYISTSRDGGESVDAPRPLLSQEYLGRASFFSGFGADTQGNLYVTVATQGDSDAGEDTDVWLFQSTDDGRTFHPVGKIRTIHPTPRQLPQNKFRTPSFMELAIDRNSSSPFHDRIYVFWPEYSQGQSDVLSMYSTDGGKTWSDPVNIATDPKNDQFFMRPEVGPDGIVHVLFASRAFDPQNRLLDQIHAYSTDGGRTWVNMRLTNSSYDGDKGVHQDGFPFIGDYNGIRVGPDGVVWAAWGDTRTGVAEIAVARIVPEPKL